MSQGKKPPIVYVIAGPNGAGKTTFATSFLPDFVQCQEFLNADLIAAGLAPFAPETQNVRAGRLMLERIRELAAEKVSFGFESTLSGRTHVRLLTRLKETGYQIAILFLWLPEAKMAKRRVRERVRQGGHDVPAEDIERRYAAGLRNFFHLYRPLLDRWCLFNASNLPPNLVASAEQDMVIVHEKTIYERIREQAGYHREEEN